MRFLLDTSSLLAFVKYIQPFENEGKLASFLHDKIISGEIVLLDSVIEESLYIQNKIISTSLPFLKNKKHSTQTKDLFPTKTFFNMLENQFCVQIQRKKLNDTEFENRKKDYLNSADAKLILFALQNKSNLGVDSCVIVTEESYAENDGKVFKKIPTICDSVQIEHCNITYLLKNHFALKLSEYVE